VRGRPEHRLEHAGGVVLFASAENLARFRAEPGRFLPAYGGWCAYGVRMGQLVESDPRVFRIDAGRLFLHHDPGTRHVWRLDLAENIAVADRVWPKIAGGREG
jgi:hypothetical protein